MCDSNSTPRPSDRFAVPALVVTAVVLWALLWLFAHADRTLAMRGRQMGLFFAAFGVFLIASVLVWRRGANAPHGLMWFVVITGVVMRLTLAPVRPVTTSDIYRYLWEGRVVRSGHNPYLYAPNAPQLASLRDGMWPLVQHKSVPAAYPPVAQYVFALSDALPTDRVITLKLVLALFDIGTVLLLPGLLVRLGRPPSWVLLYAWHPLVVGEVVARGHLDSIGIFFLVLALRLALLGSRRACLAAGACFSASILAKGYALLVLPFLLAKARARWAFLAGLAAAAAAAYSPFLSAGGAAVSGALSYLSRWQGNASAFTLVDLALRPASTSHDALARFICSGLLLAWLASLVTGMRRQPARLSWTDASFLALAGLLILSPVVYPWYLAWTVPFLCLRPRVGWLLLTGTIFSFYAHDFAGHHVEIQWVTALEYGVPALVGVAAAWRARRESAAPVIGATCA